MRLGLPGSTRHVLTLRPGAGLEPAGDGVRALDVRACFEAEAAGPLPSGWVVVRVELEMLDGEVEREGALWFDRGHGFRIEDSVGLGLAAVDGRGFVCWLPPDARALRFLPAAPGCRMRAGRLVVRRIPRAVAMARLAWPRVQELRRRPGGLVAGLRFALAIWRRGGLRELASVLMGRQRLGYGEWVRRYDRLAEADRRAIRARIEAMAARPLISVVMPVYQTPEALLREAIESVRAQLYPAWELCIADDASTAPHVRRVLAEAAAADARIRVVHRAENGHIARASNSALELATGAFVALLDHDDRLAEHALYMVAEELAAHPDADLLYSDEDKLDLGGQRTDPVFKPDWNYDYFLSQNYVSHLVVARTALVRAVGGFRPGFDGSQDYDLLLRLVERTAPGRIRHIPFVLYHWRATAGSVAGRTDAKPYAYEAARRALAEHLERVGTPGEVTFQPRTFTYRVRFPVPDPAPLVSVIVPTRDRLDLLERCVAGVLGDTAYPRLELIVVDNQSVEPRTLAYLARIAEDPRVRVLPYDAPFNYADMNNRAVAEARGELVCLLNNDTEVTDPGWLAEMVSQAMRPGVGAVGALLYYPDDTIQHGGVILGYGGIAAHLHSHLPRGSAGLYARAAVVQAMSAVTAACMVIRRSVFEEVGGFDAETFVVAYNDVDLCLRIGARGHRIVWTPHAEMRHHESASLGLPTTPARRARFFEEEQSMRDRWGPLLERDPAYNPNLSLMSAGAVANPPRVSPPWRA